MGQQQLLLIVLGIIIIGIAVIVGINVFSASSSQSNRDAVISDLTNLCSIAQQYYRKPAALGGGDNTFTGWTIPANLTSNGNGTYTATASSSNVTFIGIGNQAGNDGATNVKITMVIGSDAIISTTVDN